MADNSHRPLHGLVICCTALPQDVRTNLASIAEELGAVHKLDLTCDVTHLICGSTNTPKYQYTAKERPDIAVLHPEWIQAVRQEWMTGDEVDLAALERQHRLPTFFELKACLTGFTDTRERESFKDTFEKHGAEYHGDLTKQVTHLIAHTASGPKYEHALSWRIHVVTAKWFQDCLHRGMVLDEALYHPSMPIEHQGRGAFKKHAKPRTSLGKRERAAETATGSLEEPGKRKLRRSASTRLNADSQDLWQDMAGREDLTAASVTDQWKDDSTHEHSHNDHASIANEVLIDRTEIVDQPAYPSEPQGLFSGAYVLIHGFNHEKAKLLREYLQPNGATIVVSAADLEASSTESPYSTKYMLVPHYSDIPVPAVPRGTKLVSQWWLERCIQHKSLHDPDVDALSQPLPKNFIPGFERLSINMTGLNSVDLRQSAEAVKVVGATYAPNFGPQVSVLLSPSPAIKYEKAQYAAKHNIPAVRIEWFYDCLKSRSMLPLDDYRIALAPYIQSQTGTPPTGATVALESTGSKKTGEMKPQRLSNCRKKHPAPSLSFQAAPPPASASTVASRCKVPFILEDCEDDSAGSPLLTTDEPSEITPSHIQPLGERSPNASPRKAASSAGAEDIPVDKKPRDALNTDSLYVPNPLSPPKTSSQPHKTTSSDPIPSLMPSLSRPANEVAADLASLISRSNSRGSDHTTPAPAPTKRKHRPLGRNLSGSNNARSSCPAAVDSAEDLGEAPLLGTQIGYQSADAGAHRLLMEKRMNVDLRDHAGGQRVASIGTVKDSGSAGGHAGEGRRERHRAR